MSTSDNKTPKGIMSLKPLLGSTKCGGEIKDVLKEFARVLVSEDDFSCQIEREVNEERKHRASKTSMHVTTYAGIKRVTLLHDGHGWGLNRDFASGLGFWYCLTNTPSFKARFPQCQQLVDDLNAARKRAYVRGPKPVIFSVAVGLHAVHKLLVCEAAEGGQTFYYKTWTAMNSCGLARVGNAGGENGIGFGVDATKKEEIFDALRVEFAPAAAFFVELHDRKAHHKDCSCVLKEGQTATFEIIPMGRTHAYGLTKVWDVEEDRYKWLDGGVAGKTPAYRRGNRYLASVSPSTPLRLR